MLVMYAAPGASAGCCFGAQQPPVDRPGASVARLAEVKPPCLVAVEHLRPQVVRLLQAGGHPHQLERRWPGAARRAARRTRSARRRCRCRSPLPVRPSRDSALPVRPGTSSGRITATRDRRRADPLAGQRRRRVRVGGPSPESRARRADRAAPVQQPVPALDQQQQQVAGRRRSRTAPTAPRPSHHRDRHRVQREQRQPGRGRPAQPDRDQVDHDRDRHRWRPR